MATARSTTRLTYGELSLIGFALRGPTKWVFWGDFGGRDEDIWWESTSVLRIARFQTSLVRVWHALYVAFCMGKATCHRWKCGQVLESPALLPEVAGNLRCQKAALSTFDYHVEQEAQLSLTNRAMLVCKVIEVWQDFLSEYVDKKFTYICYRRLIRHEWIYYGSKNYCVIYNSYKIV